MTKIYDPYDVMAARKTDPAARYVLATDFAKLEAELASANAALDRLREVVPEKGGDNWCYACNRFVGIDYVRDYEDVIRKCDNCGSWHYDSSTDAADFLRTILYPTPENEND